MKVDNLNRAIGSIENLIANLDRNIEVVIAENKVIGGNTYNFTVAINRFKSAVTSLFDKILARIEQYHNKVINRKDSKMAANLLSIRKGKALRANLAKLFEE